MLAAVFIILAKTAGAISKIPLTALLGAENSGIYQAAFPLYGLLISLSSGGLTSCVSAKVSAGKSSQNPVGNSTVRFLAAVSTIAAALAAAVSFVAAPAIAKAQGAADIAPLYRILAPSVIFSAYSSVLKGWLNGNRKYAASAAGEFISQAVKAVAGTAGALIFSAINPALAPSAAAAGVTLSEFASLAYFLFLFKRNTKSIPSSPCDYRTAKNIILKSIPLAAGSLITPLCSLAESFIILNALGKLFSAADAASFYGLKEGVAGALLALPAAVFSALYSYFLPILSADKKQTDFTPALGCFTFSGIIFFLIYSSLSAGIINALYPSLAPELSEKAAFLLSTGASTALFGAISQAFTALLHAKGITWQPTLLKAASAAIKLTTCFSITPLFGINGAMLAQVIGSAAGAAAILIYSTVKANPSVNLRKFVFPALAVSVFGIGLGLLKPIFAVLSPLFAVALTGICAAALSAAACTAAVLVKKVFPNKNGGSGV